MTSVKGLCGPNSYGYASAHIRVAAKNLKEAISLVTFGYLPAKMCKLLPESHPMLVALQQLAQADKETCEYANEAHDPKLFEPYDPRTV